MNAGNVFRAYDIRGVVDKDFNAEWVTHLGKACGTYLAGRGISSAVIGYDATPRPRITTRLWRASCPPGPM